jgi:L-ascorbate metabolism protein UlaG (beta-lactamase superfamily)
MNSTSTKKHHVTLTWFGHSAFLVESTSGTRVLIDPWLENPNAPKDAASIDNIKLILVTHGHSDHLGNTVELAHRTGADIVAIFEVGTHLEALGLPRVHGINIGGSTTLHGITVTMVEARHSASIKHNGTVIPGGLAAGYVLRLENGYRLYHAGDTGLFSDMKLIGQKHLPHVVMLPIGGYYTMGPKDAAVACKWLRAKHIVGMHYGTFPELTGSPEELIKYLPMPMKSRVKILTPGTSVRF